MHDATIQGIESRFDALSPLLNEQLRRQWAGAEARSLGWGGISMVHQATGLARNTISRGLEELEQRERDASVLSSLRLRVPGGGRNRASASKFNGSIFA